ncbi:MAG: hypothetical protein IT560_04915 [Alphaproteobacteria bacterium]|nr:hypothetical protein [Alphaproteobacteria bacterium]
MAQDGQVDTPPSAEDKKAPEASGGTVTAVAETPVVAEGSKYVANFEVKRPELKPGDQLRLFDFETEGVGLTPSNGTPAIDLTDTSKGPAAKAAALSADSVAVAPTPQAEAAAEEGAEKKKDATVGQPNIAPVGEAANNAAKKDTTAAPVSKTDTAPVIDADDALDGDEANKDTRYRSVFAKNSMPAINAVWPAGDVSDELKETLGLTGKVKKNDKYGLDFHLPNGHVIEWHANLGGSEFIGMRKRTAKFGEEEAHAVAVTAKARGWSAINVHGNQKQKELMWLHAKMNGLEVANFEPMYSEDPNNVHNRLAAFNAEKNDKLTIGATPASHQMNLSGVDLSAPQTTGDEPDPETPASNKPAAKAEGDAPVKAEGDRPAVAETDKPVTEKPAVAEGAKPAVAEGDKPVLAEGDKPVVAEGDKPVTAAADKGTTTSFGIVTPPKNEALASATAEVREKNADNPEAQASLDAIDKIVKGKPEAGEKPAVDTKPVADVVEKPAADKPEAAAAKTGGGDKGGKPAKKAKGRTP